MNQKLFLSWHLLFPQLLVLNIKGVCNYMQKEVQAKLVAFEQGGFRGDYSIGLTEVYKLLVNNLSCKEQRKRKKIFNIIGASMGSYRACVGCMGTAELDA